METTLSKRDSFGYGMKFGEVINLPQGQIACYFWKNAEKNGEKMKKTGVRYGWNIVGTSNFGGNMETTLGRMDSFGYVLKFWGR
jgi:hypothetical protein